MGKADFSINNLKTTGYNLRKKKQNIPLSHIIYKYENLGLCRYKHKGIINFQNIPII